MKTIFIFITLALGLMTSLGAFAQKSIFHPNFICENSGSHSSKFSMMRNGIEIQDILLNTSGEIENLITKFLGNSKLMKATNFTLSLSRESLECSSPADINAIMDCAAENTDGLLSVDALIYEYTKLSTPVRISVPVRVNKITILTNLSSPDSKGPIHLGSDTATTITLSQLNANIDAQIELAGKPATFSSSTHYELESTPSSSCKSSDK